MSQKGKAQFEILKNLTFSLTFTTYFNLIDSEKTQSSELVFQFSPLIPINTKNPFNKFDYLKNLNYSKSLLPILQSKQVVLKFSITVSPPFDQGIIWSICNSTFGSFAGERPQITHLKLSLCRTL